MKQLLINGEKLSAVAGKSRTILNPATGEPLAEVAEADAQDIEAAVEAAHEAFYEGSWRTFDCRMKMQVLLKLAALIRENASDLASLESQNVGKPIRESRDEVDLAADCFEYYAGAINKVGGQTIPAAAPGVNLTLREPVGVCGLILPWNFPLAIASWKVAPALAMGNSVVVKPAELTPLTALRLGELALDAGVPPGTLNVVTGSGENVGEPLVRHPLVRKISFTGSTEIGTRVMKLAADDIKRVTLELGGKSANIVFADANLERAIPAAIWSALGNAGQDCCARSRLLIERTIFDRFVMAVENQLKDVRLGNPLDETTEVGSLISRKHREHVQEYVTSGLDEGVTLVCGGDIPAESAFENGAYFTPTLLSDVRPSMRVAREEIFGPVLCAIPFGREEEAIRIANDSSYGLSGSIWTSNLERALRVARALETGVLSINSPRSVHLEVPFGGVKRSGLGRELGLAALDHYSEIKSVYIHTE